MLLATGLPTQDLYNAQIDNGVAATITTRPETGIIRTAGHPHNARRRIRDRVTNVPTLTSLSALRFADSLGDPVFDDSILEGLEIRRGAPGSDRSRVLGPCLGRA